MLAAPQRPGEQQICPVKDAHASIFMISLRKRLANSCQQSKAKLEHIQVRLGS